MSTNFKKLVGWNLDEYNKLSDDGCLVCLTEKQRYLLGQMTRQIEWMTRWDNPSMLTMPDLSEIAGELDYKMSEQGCIDFCQMIIDCINDPESGVSDVITGLVQSELSESALSYAQSQSNLALSNGNNPTCDLDAWWGGIVNMIDAANQNNVDALQILEVLTNATEWAAQVAGGLLGVEAPVAQSIADWATFIQQSILENYEAQITQEYLETIACDLFCIARVNCELTPEDITNYFFERLGSALTYQSLLQESLEFIFFGFWTGTEIADAMFLSQFVFRGQFGRWFDMIAFNSIQLDLLLGFNNPDSDWVLLCTDCTTDIIVTFDELTTAEFTVTGTNGQLSPVTRNYDLQSDIQGNPVPSARAGYGSNSGLCGLWIYVTVEFPSVIDLTSVDFDYWFKQPANNNLATGIYLYDINGDPITSTRPTTVSSQETWHNFNFNTSQSGVKKILCEIAVIGNCAVFNASNTDGYIDNIRIRGVPI